MNISEMRFPRQLETAYGRDAIRRVLTDRTVRLWPGGDLDVPLVMMKDPLRKALQASLLKGLIRCGFESVSDKLRSEREGIASAGKRSNAPHGERVSRLVLFTNDGAERFYRHIEQLLRSHAPRLLGCFLDVPGSVLGQLVTRKEREVKLVMAEHKDAVSEILRAIVGGQEGGDRPSSAHFIG